MPPDSYEQNEWNKYAELTKKHRAALDISSVRFAEETVESAPEEPPLSRHSRPRVPLSNCWIGANTVILPGVTIGHNSVIGAGSVVTGDIPENVVAAGNPCRVIRSIQDRDLRYYYKDRTIDPDDLAEERSLR